MMPVFVVVGLIAAFLRGGRLQAYLDDPLRFLALPIIAFALKAAIPLWEKLPMSSGVWMPILVIAEYSLLTWFCIVNFRRDKLSFVLIGAGTIANFIAHVSGGFRMPVLIEACTVEPLPQILAPVLQGLRPEYTAVTLRHPLWFLGDCIPIPYVIPGLASIGDLLIGIGVFILLQRLLVKRHK